MSLNVTRFTSIHEVDESLWDSLNAEVDLFHTYRFIRSIEDAEIENSRFWYLLFSEDDDVVASAALSSFTISLDLFMGKRAQGLVRTIRRILPRFCRIEVLFCGLPISIGKHGIAFADHSRKQEVILRLVDEMRAICRDENISYLCVKEFLKDEIDMVGKLTHLRFFRADSMPYIKMRIQWDDYQSYLSSMRHSYRRQILQDLKKLDCTEPVIEERVVPGQDPEIPQLVILSSEDCDPDQFYSMYLDVMDRVQTRLEVLNESFFEILFENLNEDLVILMMIRGTDILSAAVLAVEERTVTFLLAGLDYAERDTYGTYVNLLHGIVQYAIQSGCDHLHLGQTSDWLKQRIGGVCIPQFIFISARHRFTYLLLKSLRSLLFPKPDIRTPHVFKA